MRRQIRTSIVAPTAEPAAQIAALLPILGPRLATLKGMSRSHADWLMDNIVQPVRHAGLLPIPQAVATLADDFRRLRRLAGLSACCERRVAALIDYRQTPAEHDGKTGRAIEAEGRIAPGTAAVPVLQRLVGLLKPLLPETAAALDEAAGYFAGQIPLSALRLFPPLWARGQPYLSLIRRHPWPQA